MDFLVSLTIFLVLFPLFLVIAVTIFIASGKNPFFIQHRPGKNERIFKIIKFKTMTDTTDANGNLLPDDQRLNGFGKFIRSTSLDEIPQLLNVIKGDMSIVGPRPLLPEYLPLYNDFQRQRHQLRPGITGYAQVNGRNAVSWEKKFELDVFYVKKISFVLDLQILFKTVSKVFSRSDISGNSAGTMNRFKGTKE
ncbi:Bacterial sugar transferase [Constantimarinum furrinae]|uniref:Bacterial sugar transferase n=1 Tax=Constantimarinum furrinae TaxID=2562285 RepID=A0A7G8PX76_9FLAO|nr:Bacterial sugar transferase [Constantimarinum furrinae]